MSNKEAPSITGLDVQGDGLGGIGLDIVSQGSLGQPSVGAEITAMGGPGQKVTGLRVSQAGPGIGMRVTQSGPGVGLKITTGVRPEDKK